MRVLPYLAVACVAVAAMSATAQAQASPDPLVLTANPYVGTPVSPYDQRVSPYSSYGARNPYTTGGGRVVAADGQYLGRLNSNQYDPESVSNPYGKYGAPYSPTSINNPYSQYGSQYSPTSARNPYATQAPKVYYTPATKPQPAYTPYKYEPYQP